MTQVVREADPELISEPENDLLLRALVQAGSVGSDVSITWVQLDGRHRRLRSVRTTRIYYVLEGSFVFEIDSDLPRIIRRADLVILKPGTEYDLVGSGTYLVINTPAYVNGDDVYV